MFAYINAYQNPLSDIIPRLSAARAFRSLTETLDIDPTPHVRKTGSTYGGNNSRYIYMRSPIYVITRKGEIAVVES
jgi:hypothetical protein